MSFFPPDNRQANPMNRNATADRNAWNTGNRETRRSPFPPFEADNRSQPLNNAGEHGD